MDELKWRRSGPAINIADNPPSAISYVPSPAHLPLFISRPVATPLAAVEQKEAAKSVLSPDIFHPFQINNSGGGGSIESTMISRCLLELNFRIRTH
jgi:hypothetical protein